MKRNVKIFCAALALVLVFGVVVGGTVAWLTAKTNTVTNTFTIGNVAIDLEEDGDSAKVNAVSKEFHLTPGTRYEKDPKVSVEEDSDACWLFVKVEENIKEGLTFTDYVNYTVLTGEDEWTKLTGVDNVYYRAVDEGGTQVPYSVIGFNKIENGEPVVDACYLRCKRYSRLLYRHRR